MINLKAHTIILLVSTCCQAGFTPAQLAKIHEHAEPCNKQLGIPANRHLEERAEDGDPTLEDELSKKFLFCVMLRMKNVDERGDIQREQFTKFVADGHDTANLTKALDECSPKTGAPEERTLHFYKCYYRQQFFKI
ncbi:uncharacterized protein LOC119766416 [Culex quinquefasciatus]|uniref:uncharacterized protein LOC119766416 n=1 Tax=Culex quinquefasciatus TaxID=7176 RepID=UPI0018E38ADE|nr:uncharacterized protein LOC119766416 [Culex quinquefasciatus]